MLLSSLRVVAESAGSAHCTSANAPCVSPCLQGKSQKMLLSLRDKKMFPCASAQETCDHSLVCCCHRSRSLIGTGISLVIHRYVILYKTNVLKCISSVVPFAGSIYVSVRVPCELLWPCPSFSYNFAIRYCAHCYGKVSFAYWSLDDCPRPELFCRGGRLLHLLE